jgi:hypothetical protein
MFAEAKLVGGLGLAAALLFGYQQQMAKARDAGQQQCTIDTIAEQSRLAGRANIRNQEIVDAYRKEAALAADAAAAGRHELDRVRAAAAARGAASSPTGSAGGTDDEAGALRRLLVEGAELVEEGRRRVGELSAKVIALQEKVSECTASP